MNHTDNIANVFAVPLAMIGIANFVYSGEASEQRDRKNEIQNREANKKILEMKVQAELIKRQSYRESSAARSRADSAENVGRNALIKIRELDILVISAQRERYRAEIELQKQINKVEERRANRQIKSIQQKEIVSALMGLKKGRVIIESVNEPECVQYARQFEEVFREAGWMTGFAKGTYYENDGGIIVKFKKYKRINSSKYDSIKMWNDDILSAIAKPGIVVDYTIDSTEYSENRLITGANYDRIFESQCDLIIRIGKKIN